MGRRGGELGARRVSTQRQYHDFVHPCISIDARFLPHLSIVNLV
jgi:hypothetical protein